MTCHRQLILILSFIWLFAGCGEMGHIHSKSSASTAAIQVYCPYLPSRTFATESTGAPPARQISGHAFYEFRVNGNGSISASPRPIRFAEVRVTDSSGALIQCAETDQSGAFLFSLPNGNSNYTVSVTSRAANSKNSAFVMNNPTANSYYAVSTGINTSQSDPTLSQLHLVAPASGTFEGGAFNILDQILNTQEFLRNSTRDCDQSGSSNFFHNCIPFTVAPSVNVYWSPGLNPGKYVGESSAISFYINGKKELYILGGINGDTEVSDMDHFDNSVIIHEYSHFIEDQFSYPSSPGGSHTGNGIIDPRLAWGEGWADFLQAAVTGSPIYRDTYGHVGCVSPTPGSLCTGVNFNESLEFPTSDLPSSIGGIGEGNFREFSVARALWSALVQTPTSPATYFSEIWTAFTGQLNSLRIAHNPFNHIGHLHVLQQQQASPHSDWTEIRNHEQQAGDLSAFATPLVSPLSDGSCPYTPSTMNIVKTGLDNGSFATSDLMRNNDFYAYHHPGGDVTITLNLSSADGNVDLDLYLLEKTYLFGDKKYWIRASNTSGSSSESIHATLGADNYMIHVMAYTGIYPSPTTRVAAYRLTINGVAVCPGR
jgi:hypothetical protein